MPLALVMPLGKEKLSVMLSLMQRECSHLNQYLAVIPMRLISYFYLAASCMNILIHT